METEIRRLKEYVLFMFEEEYEANSYDDDNLSSCIRDFIDSKFIYIDDAKDFVNNFGLLIFNLFLQSNANGNQAIIGLPIKVESIAKDALMCFCFEYMHTDLLKIKQKIDKRGW